MTLRYTLLNNLRCLPLKFASVVILLSCFQENLHAQLPTNLDFGSGNFTNWKCWVGYAGTGTAATGAAFNSASVSSPIGGNAPGPGSVGRSRHFVTSGTGTSAQYYNLIITPYASIGVADTIRSPILTLRSVGLNSKSLSAVSVYPNPSSATLHIIFPSPFERTVSLMNSLGESVYSKPLSKSASFDIPTARFTTGIYTLVLKDVHGTSDVRQVAIRR